MNTFEGNVSVEVFNCNSKILLICGGIRVVWHNALFGSKNFSIDEVREFIHVNPKTTGCNVVVFSEIHKTLSPEVKWLRMVEINVIDLSWPDTTNKIFFGFVWFLVDTHFFSSDIGDITKSNTSIDNRNPMNTDIVRAIN